MMKWFDRIKQEYLRISTFFPIQKPLGRQVNKPATVDEHE
jgi:hypothetical protein